MIPTKTGAAAAVGLVLPELNGKLDGYAIRVPTINVSIVDLSFIAARDTTVEEVNQIMKEASEGALKGILTYNDRAAGVGRLQPQPGFVELRCDADQGVGPSGEGVVAGTTTSGASRTACWIRPWLSRTPSKAK